MLQRDLWKRLGLHHSTISKALTRLRDLGWAREGFGPKKIDGMEEWQRAWYQGIVPRDDEEDDDWYDDDAD